LYSKPRIEVITSTDPHDRDEIAIGRRRLEQWVNDEIDHPHSPELSDAAITLWFCAVNRLRRAAALGATNSKRRSRSTRLPRSP